METLHKITKPPLIDIGRGIKAGLINITPDQAKKMLEHNNHNRAKKINKINQYASDMGQGLWQMNGVPIIFNHSGSLLDGQNRLNAIIKSGVPCEMIVITGISMDSFHTIDTGANRSPGDVLGIIGLQPKKAIRISSLINRVLKDNYGMLSTAWNPAIHKRVNTTNHDILKYYQHNKQELDDIYEFCAKYENKISKVIPMPVYLFIFHKLRKINIIQAEEFCSKLATGNMLSGDDPIYQLRERLITLRSSKTEKAPGWHYSAYTYKAWNAYRKGKKIQKLYIAHNETGPVKPI
jgi:hypothetical protein